MRWNFVDTGDRIVYDEFHSEISLFVTFSDYMQGVLFRQNENREKLYVTQIQRFEDIKPYYYIFDLKPDPIVLQPPFWAH